MRRRVRGVVLAPVSIERRGVGKRDVSIEVRFSGICHSDLHQAAEDWGQAIFPMVPGHEIAGVVVAVGAEVTKHRVDDRVGVGCFVDSCRECVNCRVGQEQHCQRGEVATYNGRFYDGTPTYGGYSTALVVDEDYVLKIPDNLELSVAAPLLCAGITLFSPLQQWGAGPGRQVAIIGLGGLGHLGVKIAHALGAEVTVLSRDLAKKADGERLGADHYYATEDRATFQTLASRFDLVIDTASATVDLSDYLGLLKLSGTLVLAGMPGEPFTLPVIPLMANQRRVVGTKNGGIPETQQMLDFCGQHHIGADIEIIPADRINDAWQRLQRGDVRYRFVIDISTL